MPSISRVIRRMSLLAKVTIMILSSLIVLAIAIWAVTARQMDRDARLQAREAQERNLRVAWDVLGQYGHGFRVVDGALYLGSRRLSGFNEPVDRVQRLVGGNSSILLGDVRTATTVRNRDGSRAIGSRMGPEPREAVLRRGQSYRGATDIVGVPHFTAYDPIRDADGRVVGALLVGIPVDQFMRATHNAQRSIALASLLVTLLALTLCFFGARAMFRPLGAMRSAMEDLTQGRFGIEIPGAGRADEIGRMAGALVVLRDAGIAKEKAEAAARQDEEARQLVVEALRRGLGSLSEGDLAAEVSSRFPPAYEELRANFNNALRGLRELIGSVMVSMAGLRTGAGEIAQASEDLARRTESNAASLEQTSAAIGQIDGRIKATAGAAGRTVARADEAIATVGGGRAVADQAVEAMGRVSESARGIDDVIEGLDKIAFQTRVLAMNAAVEAGRAGDAGRGFAVVADLVSALAMRAEEEAKKARDQLSVTQTEIVAAVEAVRRVDGALVDISDGVGEVHQLLGSMAADNLAQASAITQISAAIVTMDQATQQNAAMVEQTSAAARNLDGEVESLAQQAGRFRVVDNGRPVCGPATRIVPVSFRPAARDRSLAGAAAGGTEREAAPLAAEAAGAWKDF